MPIDILCIGHASFDLSVFVDSFPREDSKCEVAELRESGGGPASNAAYLLSSWGNRCGFAGLVGDDDYGLRIREEFRAVGTDISLLESRAGHATPLSILLINKQNGSRTIVNRKAAASAFHTEAEPLKKMSPRILLFDGHELAASLEALRAFPDAISILDAGSLREGTAGLAGRVDYLAASARFALQSTGSSDLESTDDRHKCLGQLCEKYQTSVIVTMGEHGLIADDGGGFIHVPAVPAQTVDTTAAGDIFHGAFAHAIFESMPFLESLRFASLTASLSVRLPGGRSSIPSLKTVKEEFARVG